MKNILCALMILALCLCVVAQAESIEDGAENEPSIVFVAPKPEYVGISGEVTGTEIQPTDGAEAAEQLQLTGVVIGIDPGHQEQPNSELEPIAPGSSEMKAKVSSGTQGVRTRIPEYETNLTISLQLRDALEALGATVYMTRETNDVNISNMERAQFFNEHEVDLALRIHCNGSSNSGVNGVGTYARQTGEKQAESELAANFLLDAICEATGANRDGVFLRDTYTGQNWCSVPCVMVEMGYMSNPEEDEKLNDPDYQQKMVAGIAEGVCRYIGAMVGSGGYWTLQRGSRGSNVQALQEMLIEQGHLNDRADGIFGPKTEAAVRAFQTANGLEPTGIADAQMQKALFEGTTEELKAEEALE